MPPPGNICRLTRKEAGVLRQAWGQLDVTSAPLSVPGKAIRQLRAGQGTGQVGQVSVRVVCALLSLPRGPVALDLAPPVTIWDGSKMNT